MVVASLGAIRKDKPGGVVTARVLFDGTNAIHVNRRTRMRDQERSPTAADLKRLMYEKIPKRQKDPCSRRGRGHRQAPAGLAHARVPSEAWRSSLCPHCRYLRSGVRVLSLVAGCGGDWACHAVVLEAKRTRGMYLFHLAPALFAFFVVCVVARVPLSWPKTAGGFRVARISSGSLSTAQHGLSSGHELQQNRRQSTWPSLRRVWKESCP